MREASRDITRTAAERTRAGFTERRAARPRNGLKLARMALFTALGAALGYALSGVPNVELVTATVFIAGAVLGPAEGALVGAAAEALYTSFHPMGAPAPPLWIAQVLSMSLAGWFGGIWSRFRPGAFIRSRIGTVATGLVCTLTFDLLTTASFAFFVHFNVKQLVQSFAFGLWFYVLHAAGNAVIFYLLVPAVLSRLAALAPTLTEPTRKSS
jgi:uncharacterized membrane protein